MELHKNAIATIAAKGLSASANEWENPAKVPLLNHLVAPCKCKLFPTAQNAKLSFTRKYWKKKKKKKFN